MQKNKQKHYRDTKRLDILMVFLCSPNFDDNEVWREIPGYDGDYFVSNKGRILSLCRNEAYLLNPYICSNSGNRIGYYYVDLRGKNQRVNRLVASAFLENPEDKPVVHHKDNNTLNNNVENLVYATYAENAQEYQNVKKDYQKQAENL